MTDQSGESVFQIDRTSRIPLWRQLYAALRDRMLGGMLPEGRKLPATRELARELGVSRLTVVEAYEQLAAEGYVVAKVGAGSFVAPGTRLRAGTRRRPVSANREPAEAAARTVPAPASTTSAAPLGYRTDVIDFRTGLPDLSSFPVSVWQRLTRDRKSVV